MAWSWGSPLLPPPGKGSAEPPESSLPPASTRRCSLPPVSRALTASGFCMHPAHPQPRFPTADKWLHLQTPSVSFLAEQRHHLTFEKGLETRRGGCKEILGEAAAVPSPTKGHAQLRDLLQLCNVPPPSTIGSFTKPWGHPECPRICRGDRLRGGGLREGVTLGVHSTETGTSIPLPITQPPAEHC